MPQSTNSQIVEQNDLPVVAVLGFPLGPVGRSEFGRPLSGLSGVGSALLLPATDQYVSCFHYLSLSHELYLLLKYNVLSSLTPNATKHLKAG